MNRDARSDRPGDLDDDFTIGPPSGCQSARATRTAIALALIVLVLVLGVWARGCVVNDGAALRAAPRMDGPAARPAAAPRCWAAQPVNVQANP